MLLLIRGIGRRHTKNNVTLRTISSTCTECKSVRNHRIGVENLNFVTNNVVK